MSTVSLLADEDLSPAAAAVFADIRAKQVMAPGALDAKTKELIYIAVSVAQGCDYCIASHTASARAKGMSEAEYMELVGVIGMAAETNRLALALQVPVDEAFKTLPLGGSAARS
jgi:AhpD family alkylhydroperoxidase